MIWVSTGPFGALTPWVHPTPLRCWLTTLCRHPPVTAPAPWLQGCCWPSACTPATPEQLPLPRRHQHHPLMASLPYIDSSPWINRSHAKKSESCITSTCNVFKWNQEIVIKTLAIFCKLFHWMRDCFQLRLDWCAMTQGRTDVLL